MKNMQIEMRLENSWRGLFSFTANCCVHPFWVMMSGEMAPWRHKTAGWIEFGCVFPTMPNTSLIPLSHHQCITRRRENLHPIYRFLLTKNLVRKSWITSEFILSLSLSYASFLTDILISLSLPLWLSPFIFCLFLLITISRCVPFSFSFSSFSFLLH